ncbi:trace amine-associated receptor 1-like [Xenentodon cancila]
MEKERGKNLSNTNNPRSAKTATTTCTQHNPVDRQKDTTPTESVGVVFESLETEQVVLLHIMLSVISLFTVTFNLLVIISVSHFRQLHTPTNILLHSLAVSDFLVGLVLMPGEIIRKTSCWFLGDLMCSLYNYVSYVITSASVGDMVLISVDRYVAICDPLHYPTRVTEKRVKVCVCLCWLCSFLYSSIIVKDELTHPGRYTSCYGECVIVVNYILGTFDLVITFVVPITVIIVLYMKVFVVAVSQARAMRSQITAVTLQLSVTATTKRSELKASRTLGVLVVVFLLCFCPYYCVSLAGDDLLSDSRASYAIFLFYLNSSLNPIIYALFYPWFRKAVKLIITLQTLQPGSCEANWFIGVMYECVCVLICQGLWWTSSRLVIRYSSSHPASVGLMMLRRRTLFAVATPAALEMPSASSVSISVSSVLAGLH